MKMHVIYIGFTKNFSHNRSKLKWKVITNNLKACKWNVNKKSIAYKKITKKNSEEFYKFVEFSPTVKIFWAFFWLFCFPCLTTIPHYKCEQLGETKLFVSVTSHVLHFGNFHKTFYSEISLKDFFIDTKDNNTFSSNLFLFVQLTMHIV